MESSPFPFAGFAAKDLAITAGAAKRKVTKNFSLSQSCGIRRRPSRGAQARKANRDAPDQGDPAPKVERRHHQMNSGSWASPDRPWPLSPGAWRAATQLPSFESGGGMTFGSPTLLRISFICWACLMPSWMKRLITSARCHRLTQEEFAERYQIPVGTLRDWEQGRSEPDQPARSYLKVIARDPEHVRMALARAT
jgi:hypothetical protein